MATGHVSTLFLFPHFYYSFYIPPVPRTGDKMSTYGKRLLQERLRLHLTQKQLAAAGGVGRHAQSLYERDMSLPRAPYLAAITLVGVDVLYILTGRHAAPHRTPPGNGLLSER